MVMVEEEKQSGMALTQIALDGSWCSDLSQSVDRQRMCNKGSCTEYMDGIELY